MSLEQAINGKSTRREFCAKTIEAFLYGALTVSGIVALPSMASAVGGNAKKFKPANEYEAFFKWYIVDYVMPLVEKKRLADLFEHNLADKDNFVYVAEGDKRNYDGWIEHWKFLTNFVSNHNIRINNFKVEWLDKDTAKVTYRLDSDGTNSFGYQFRGYRDDIYTFNRVMESIPNFEGLDYFFGDNGIYPGDITSRWVVTKMGQTEYRRQ